MEKIKIESATINDYRYLSPLVIDFEQGLNIEHKNPPLSEKQIRRSKRYLKKYLLDKTCTYLVYRKNEKIIAYSFLSIDDDNQELGFINELFVILNERKKGIASELMEQSLNWFKEKKCQQVQLTVNKKNEFALKVYKKNGFNIHEGDYIDMRINIPKSQNIEGMYCDR